MSYYIKQRSGLSASTIANYKTAWTTLASSAKCFPGMLAADDVVAWRDGLLRKLHSRTVKSRLTFANAIWRESRVNGKIERSSINPFEGLRVGVDENVGGSRAEFPPPELRRIFSSPPLTTARAVSVHAGYWLPLLALYHGTRLEELTGLEVIDIEDSGDNGLIIHIRENALRPRLKHRKKSERSIPLHSELVGLGFGAYVLFNLEAKLFVRIAYQLAKYYNKKHRNTKGVMPCRRHLPARVRSPSPSRFAMH